MPSDVLYERLVAEKAVVNGFNGHGRVLSVFVGDCLICHYRTPDERTYMASAVSLQRHMNLAHPGQMEVAQDDQMESDGSAK